MCADSKKHHFVPRSILKRFENEEGKLFVFDKKRMVSFFSNADNAGHEKNFNSINTDEGKINFEDIFQEYDADLGALAIRLDALKDNLDLTGQEIYRLAFHTCVQRIRTKLPRTTTIEFAKALQQWTSDLYSNHPDGDRAQKIPIPSDDESKFIALAGLNDLEENTCLLLSKGIVLFKTNDDSPLWTSDNPVVMDNTFPYGKIGLKSVGTDVFFPISKKLLVAFFCEQTCKMLFENCTFLFSRGKKIPSDMQKLFDGIFRKKILSMDKETLDYVNSLQVYTSSRFLYSSRNSFLLAKQTIDKTPSLKDVKTSIGIEKGMREYSRMPDNEVLVFYMENRHFMLPIVIDKMDFELSFYSSEDELIEVFNQKELITQLEVFVNKVQIKGMREVYISNYDPINCKYTICHKDEVVSMILKDVARRKTPPTL